MFLGAAIGTVIFAALIFLAVFVPGDFVFANVVAGAVLFIGGGTAIGYIIERTMS